MERVRKWLDPRVKRSLSPALYAFAVVIRLWGAQALDVQADERHWVERSHIVVETLRNNPANARPISVNREFRRP